MAKIGILSMQRIANYGSFLQAYALKQIIEEMGHTVEFVDFHVEPTIITEHRESANKVIRTLNKVKEIMEYSVPIDQKIEFIRFKQLFGKKYFPMLGIDEKYNYTPELDCLVIGSDEVFNCIQNNSNVGYSMELFGKNNQAKRIISYAASFGNTTIEKINRFNKTNEIAELLDKFDAISVRDKNSGNIVYELTGKKAEYHLDPVLIYEYMKCCDKIPRIETTEKYLVLYAYSGRISNDEAKWISSYAKNKRLKVYTIGGIQSCSDKFINCSPFEVISYFMGAEEIITDTFHGTIFSIITHKKFSTIVRKSVGNSYGNEEKIVDLLNRLGLINRVAVNIEEVRNINSEPVDYKKVDSLLEEQRVKAKQYLRNNIKSI